MKRVIISVVLMAVMVGGGILALFDLRQVRDTMENNVEEILSYVDAGDLDAAYQKTTETADYWKQSENRLIRYIRRMSVDCITDSVAKISALVQYGEIPLFRAELALIQDQLEHMWDSELPLLRNLI